MVRCAIVGCGTIAPVHAAALSSLATADLVACCDIVPERAEAFASRFGIPRWTCEYDELLADPRIDSITICTPHYLHAPMIVQAAAAGKHVMVEKPLAMDPESGYEAVAACRRRGVKLSVCFQNRLNPATVQVKRALDQGILGDPLMLTGEVLWYRDESYYSGSPWRGRWATEGGGALINQAIHTLDLLTYLGRSVRSVFARVATLDHPSIEVDDSASVVLEFASGAIGSFVASTCAYPGQDVRVEVMGRSGSATIVGQELVRFETRDGAQPPAIEETGNGRLPVTGKDYYGGSHGLAIADYIGAIVEDREPRISGEEGLASLEVLGAIYASSRSGAAQPVPSTRLEGAPRGGRRAPA